MEGEGNQPTARLRYGLLLDSTTVAHWQAMVLDRLAEIPGVELCIAVVDGSTRSRQTLRDLLNRRQLTWTAFNRWSGRRSAALRSVDLCERLADIPLLQASRTQDGSWSELDDPTIEGLRSHTPDFLLRFGFGLLRGDVLDICPFGVWSFHHGDEHSHRGGPPCYWELVDREPTTGVLLQRLVPSIDNGVPLARAWFPTIGHSYRRNRDEAYLGAVSLPAQAARRILAGDTDFARGPNSDTAAPVRRNPTDRQMAAFLPRLAATWLRHQTAQLTAADRWHIGVVQAPIQSLLSSERPLPIEWLPRPAGRQRYLADPFGLPAPDGISIVCEDFDHAERHGHLSTLSWRPDGRTDPPKRLIKFGVHASYPFICRVDDEWWVIPETAGLREVRAFRIEADTLELEDLGPILEGVALLDPTLFEWQGRWWLFGTDQGRGSNTYLRAWYSAHPRGPWTPHNIDPIRLDVRGSRPAGTPFVVDGQLYRPAQDCSSGYGGAVAINLIETLDENHFSEREVARVEPDADGPFPDGLHTLSAIGDLTLVDGTIRVFSFASFVHELRARLRILARRPQQQVRRSSEPGDSHGTKDAGEPLAG